MGNTYMREGFVTNLALGVFDIDLWCTWMD